MRWLLVHICLLLCLFVNAQSVVVDRFETDGSHQIITRQKNFSFEGESYGIRLIFVAKSNENSWYFDFSSYRTIVDDSILLLKLSNGQILTFYANSVKSEQENTLGFVWGIGDIGLIFPSEQVPHYFAVYEISPSELDLIEQYGISKLRFGNNVKYVEKEWKRNSFGKFVTSSRKSILDRLENSDNYKRGSIREGF